jgi:hypothetical protein
MSKTIQYIIKAKLEGKVEPGKEWYDWGFYKTVKEAKDRLEPLIAERPARKFKVVERTITDRDL